MASWLRETLPPAFKGEKHAHVVFDTDAGRRLTYVDARRFGFMSLIETGVLERHPWFADMGPEPLGPDFTPAYLAQALEGRKQPIKTLLLDQHLVAGLGNIYVCEALHRARISPLKAGGEVSRAQLAKLVPAVRHPKRRLGPGDRRRQQDQRGQERC